MHMRIHTCIEGIKHNGLRVCIYFEEKKTTTMNKKKKKKKNYNAKVKNKKKKKSLSREFPLCRHKMHADTSRYNGTLYISFQLKCFP